ncbi:MAG: methyl-accepting chemotaxis protein, partial [Actinobacteria bacterium]|nr:methyl-accepting chemotaxis protein [Actinomycetota bacterium]
MSTEAAFAIAHDAPADPGGRDTAPRAGTWTRLAGRLTSRLPLRARLSLLVAALMVPTVVAVWSFAGAVGANIAFSAAERDGVVVLEPALLALAATAGGQDVDLSALRSAVDAEPALGLDELTAAAEDLVPAATDPAGRAALATALVALVTEAGNSSNLILDPDLDSFYVMDLLVVQMPKALVTASQTAVEPTGDANEKLAAQALLAGALAAAAGSFQSDVSTSLSTTSSSDLTSQLADVEAAAQAVTALSDALTAGLGDPSAQDPAAAAAAVAAAVPTATAGLDGLLATRIAGMTDERLSTLLLTAVATVVALLWAFAVVTSTRGDVDTALRGIEAIAAGDLTPWPVPDGRDEVGDIGRAISRARSSLAAVVTGLVAAASQVAGSAERLSVTARAVDSSAHETLDLSRAATSEVETVTVMLDSVSAATHQMTSATGEIATTMTEVNATAAQARDDLSHAVELASALGESSRSIERTVEAIAAVASKTRMLAL